MEEPGRKFFEKTVGRRLVVRLSPVLSLVRSRWSAVPRTLAAAPTLPWGGRVDEC